MTKQTPTYDAQTPYVHILYQLRTGKSDAGADFVSWIWSNIKDLATPIDTACDAVAHSVVGDVQELTETQAQSIVFELSCRLEVAVKALKEAPNPFIRK